jgi:hypothetical protein
MALFADQRAIRADPPGRLHLMDLATLRTLAFPEYVKDLISVLAQQLDHWRCIFRQFVPNPRALQR